MGYHLIQNPLKGFLPRGSDTGDVNSSIRGMLAMPLTVARRLS